MTLLLQNITLPRSRDKRFPDSLSIASFHDGIQAGFAGCSMGFALFGMLGPLPRQNLSRLSRITDDPTGSPVLPGKYDDRFFPRLDGHSAIQCATGRAVA